MGLINVIKLLHCPLNTKQCSAVDESLSYREWIFGNMENWTQGSWVRCANATSVLCHPPLLDLFGLAGFPIAVRSRCWFLSVLNLKSKPGEIFPEKVDQSGLPKADCTLTISDDDLESLVMKLHHPSLVYWWCFNGPILCPFKTINTLERIAKAHYIPPFNYLSDSC